MFSGLLSTFPFILKTDRPPQILFTSFILKTSKFTEDTVEGTLTVSLKSIVHISIPAFVFDINLDTFVLSTLFW